ARAMDFEGETGPYIQYACARINSIFRNYDGKIKQAGVDYSLLSSEIEQKIIRQLADFPEVVKHCAETCRTSELCRHTLVLAQLFNEFYHSHQILKENDDVKRARLVLCYCIKTVLETGLELLAIKAPEEM
ncbi:MAG: DALR anticodon-binding domain-containing protein, partial [Candidatus Woesearchaeota archaeon]